MEKAVKWLTYQIFGPLAYLTGTVLGLAVLGIIAIPVLMVGGLRRVFWLAGYSGSLWEWFFKERISHEMPKV